MIKKSTKLLSIALLLLVLASSSGFVTIYLRYLIKYDAEVINKAGIIRGSIQRLAKLEMNNIKNDTIISEIDNMINSFSSKELTMKGHNQEFYEAISQVKTTWVDFKTTIYAYRQFSSPENKLKLLTTSEKLWQESNNAVYLAQFSSEKKINYFRPLILFLLVNILLIIIILVFIRIYVRNQLEFTVNHDPLTGIYNRNFFREFLFKELARSKSYDLNLSLIMLDIDHFKKVNDQFGHDIGDNVLKELANIITKNIRSSDIFARIGGEEFVIIASETKQENAYELAEKLRKIVENYYFRKIKKLTISIGISTLSEEDNIDTLFKRADMALYSAKEAGRNTTKIN